MKLSVESIIYNEGMFYLVPKDINILFACSVNDEQIKIIDTVPEEDGHTERQFNGLCKVGNKIILVPYAARKIWIYDLICGTWKSIDVSEYVSEDVDSKFSGCVQYLEKVYLFGYGYNGILSLDTNAYKLKSIYKQENMHLWGQKIAIDGYEVNIALPNEKRIAVLNRKTEKVDFIDLDVSSNGVASVGYDGARKIILPTTGNSYYVMDNETKIKDRQLPQELSMSIYNGLAVSDKYIYGYSSWGKSFILNRESDEVKVINTNTYYVDYIKEIGFIETQKGVLNIYNNEFVKKKTISLEISDEELECYYSKYALTSRIYNESDAFDLSQYLRNIEKDNIKTDIEK